MLVALRVKNFKSIREAAVRFGPLTCIIGHNGVGKSNLFDAIHFLSLLAERDIYQATIDVRRSTEDTYSPLDLVLGRDPANEIELSADMIVPAEVVDDFGEPAKPSTTLLTYTVVLRFDEEGDRLVVEREELNHSKKGDFAEFTAFSASRAFKDSVALGARRGGPLISTDPEHDRIMLHGDGGSRGRPSPVGRSPLTVVGGTNTFDYPTVLAAKREMASWRLLHLEPSAMRTPDSRAAVPHVSDSGGRLAATFAALVKRFGDDARAEVVNRLHALNSDVIELDVRSDEVRDQLVLQAKLPGVKRWLFGRSLSDGMLRYIALALMLVDVQNRGVLCLEEPENGIHPSRVPALVDLLYDYAVDPSEPVGTDNPLRQVVINTHSPEVARQLKYDDIVFAERALAPGGRSVSVFRPITATWRASSQIEGYSVPPKDGQAVADFIGGSPIRVQPNQLRFDFGTAS